MGGLVACASISMIESTPSGVSVCIGHPSEPTGRLEGFVTHGVECVARRAKNGKGVFKWRLGHGLNKGCFGFQDDSKEIIRLP